MTQLLFRVLNTIPKRYKNITIDTNSLPFFRVVPIDKLESVNDEGVSFLNVKSEFLLWNDVSHGMLWAYNLNYMDWLCQEGMTYEEGAMWIDRFIDNIPTNKVGLDPYPIALRGINWIKFMSKFPDRIESNRLKRWNDSLFSQYLLLEKKLEWHLLGNHLLEDIYSLYIASIYFNDVQLFRKYSHLLRKQLNEQILPDGAHYEQSPMYHCILLDRLLDCINISAGRSAEVELLSRYAIKMLGHLGEICYQNGEIPLLNDAAYNIAPKPYQIFDYARRLGLEWESIPMRECGYRKLSSDNMEAIVDVGNITATYQPGHTHADTLNYELRINGKPYIVDTGISTYDKNERRQFERGTIAHNCVSPGGKDSYEVWGGFRVGRRCRTEIVEDGEKLIEAWHDGFDRPCRRRFQVSENDFVVEDWYDGEAVSYIHLAEGADENRIRIEGATNVEIKDHQYSTEYNKFHSGRVVEMHFNGYLKYTII